MFDCYVNNAREAGSSIFMFIMRVRIGVRLLY